MFDCRFRRVSLRVSRQIASISFLKLHKISNFFVSKRYGCMKSENEIDEPMKFFSKIARGNLS